MSSFAQHPKRVRIVGSVIRSESDVVSTRQRARQLAELLGFERRDQTRMATAVSELARNAFSYAGHGEAEFLVELDATPQMFLARIADGGPGIENLEEILSGQYRSATGMGLGLIGARRLMDRFEIETEPGEGVKVAVGMKMPARARPLTPAGLAAIVKGMEQQDAPDPLRAVRDQDRELIQAYEEVLRREEESQQLNQELGDTNRGVVALYAELDERAEQLRKASELKSRFLSNISHEFRTPLNSILALSRLLLDHIDGPLNAEQERQVGYIRRSAESLLDLVNDMLDLSKVEAGKADVRRSEFSVPALFGALRGALKPLLTNPSVELTFESVGDCPNLYSDEAKVSQILRNLISNALKFTERGEVRVEAAYSGGLQTMTFRVSDTGIGIAEEDQERIFEEFAQVDTRLQRRVKGTGLGLSLSRSLAMLLGGTLTVESELNRGSTFSLTIPVTPSEAAQPQGALDHEQKRILLIDDDETFRYVMRQIVSNEPRYQLIEARDGEAGLQMARTDAPDVVVLDLQMPTIDGFTVFQELRADPRTATLPVVVLTSLTIDAGVTGRFPRGTRIMSKNAVSRESVFGFLGQATSEPT